MKQNSSILFTALLILIASLYSCSKPAGTETGYEKVKNMSASSMSSADKLTLKNGLIQRLKSDPDFIAANELMDAQGSAIKDAVAERRSKGLARAEVNTNLSKTEQLAQRGIADPSSYQKNQTLMLLKMVAVIKKYPEFKKLDKVERREILKLASAQ